MRTNWWKTACFWQFVRFFIFGCTQKQIIIHSMWVTCGEHSFPPHDIVLFRQKILYIGQVITECG